MGAGLPASQGVTCCFHTPSQPEAARTSGRELPKALLLLLRANRECTKELQRCNDELDKFAGTCRASRTPQTVRIVAYVCGTLFIDVIYNLQGQHSTSISGGEFQLQLSLLADQNLVGGP